MENIRDPIIMILLIADKDLNLGAMVLMVPKEGYPYDAKVEWTEIYTTMTMESKDYATFLLLNDFFMDKEKKVTSWVTVSRMKIRERS